MHTLCSVSQQRLSISAISTRPCSLPCSSRKPVRVSLRTISNGSHQKNSGR